MKTYHISFDVDIEDDFDLELWRVVSHHIEWLIDMESHPEIKSIYNAKVLPTMPIHGKSHKEETKS